MDEQPSGPRLQIPIWAWIIAILAIVLAVQFWLSGTFSGPDDVPLTDIAAMIESGEVERIQVRGNEVTAIAEDGTTHKSVKDEGSVTEQFLNLGVSEEALSHTRRRSPV